MKGFDFIPLTLALSHPGEGIQLGAPLPLDPARTWRGGHWFTMIGRLARGVTL